MRAPSGMRNGNASAGVRRAVVGLLACAIGLVAAASAAADDYKRAITPGDQALAKAAVLQRSDFGTATVTAGPAVADGPDDACPGFNPKMSDLVLTGKASKSWQGQGFVFISEVDVLRSAAMVATDWKRSLTPAFVRCFRAMARKELGANGKLVSVGRLSFPKIGERTYALRAVADVRQAGQTVRMVLDVVLATKGRAEVYLLTVVPYALQSVFKPVEVTLTRKMVQRLSGPIA